MATTKVILKEKLDKLGNEADIVKVKTGYARNFLIPKGKAYESTKKNLHHIENLKKLKAKREALELEQAHKVSSKLKKLKLNFVLKTGEKGKAFGSVTTMDIYNELKNHNIEFDRHKISLDKPIKSTGKFDVLLKIHNELEETIKISVKSESAQEDDKTQKKSDN